MSVEGCYGDEGFDLGGAADDDKIRLVSLKSWRFSCVNEEQSFSGLLTHLDRSQSGLRLAEAGNGEADAVLRSGCIALPHKLRNGDRTFSWYRGPLVPGGVADRLSSPVRAADKLIRYNASNGLFDVSYAAAWELERLLPLQSKAFSTALYQWKRMHKQNEQAARQAEAHPDLPVQAAAHPADLPETLSSWFGRASLLEGVPFDYLVPDERMLSREAIRFFRVDPFWVDCLLDGVLETLDIHLKLEAPHFGFEPASGGFKKTLRAADGTLDEHKVIDEIPWRGKPQERVADISKLAGAIKSESDPSEAMNSARFALEMIEGAEKVRLLRAG